LKQPRLKIGKTYSLRQNYFSTLKDRIKITNIYRQRLGDISQKDVQREGFNSLEEFINAWRTFYSEYDPHQHVWVVEFKYVKPTETFKEKP